MQNESRSGLPSRRGPFGVALAATVVALAGVGCNGSSSTSPSPAGSNQVSTVVASEEFALGAGESRVVDLSLPRAGTLDVRVQWTNDDNDLEAFLTGAGCRGQDLAGDGPCRIRAQAARRERGAAIAYQAQAGDYNLHVRNLSKQAESISVTATLTYDQASPDVPPSRERPAGPPPI